MARLAWDTAGQRYYETGVKQCVLYVQDSSGTYPAGVAWNGLISVSESPSGAEASPIYADDIKYLNLYSTEEFAASLEAYTYPEEFAQCDGSAELVTGALVGQQTRKLFGLCYRTAMGNDIDGDEYGYKIHIIYGCHASPTEKSYQTINDSPEAITFSWEVSTTPVDVTNMKPTATVVIDSTKFTSAAAKTKLANLEAILYGAANFDATKTYEVGNYCTYSNKIYRCTSAITTAAAWNSSKWTEVTSTVGPRLPLPNEIKTTLT